MERREKVRRERSSERGEFALLKEQTQNEMPRMTKEIDHIQKKERLSHVQYASKMHLGWQEQKNKHEEFRQKKLDRV